LRRVEALAVTGPRGSTGFDETSCQGSARDDMAATTAIGSAAIHGGILGLLVIIVLVILLVAREVSLSVRGPAEAHWARMLAVGIIPLLIIFIVVAVIQLADTFA
jgi:hypothetical protein